MCPSYKWPVLLRWRKSGDAPRSDSIRSGSLWSIFHFISSPHYSDSWKQSSILRSQWFSACPSPTLWEDKLCLLQAPAWQWMPAELHKALYCVHPTPSHSAEWYQARRTLQVSLVLVGTSENLNRAQPGEDLAVLVVHCGFCFASSVLNCHSDLGGPGYKIMDPTPFRLHRAGGKAAALSECCWLWIYPAFGLFSVGLKAILFCCS